MGKILNNQHEKGGNGSHKWVQALVSPDVHKRLRRIALDRDCTLASLLRGIVENFIKMEKSHGRSNRSNRSSSTKEA